MGMAYADVMDVQDRMLRTMSAEEQTMCAVMLEDAAVIIDAYNAQAAAEAKKIVSCRMVIRALGDGETSGVPLLEHILVPENSYAPLMRQHKGLLRSSPVDGKIDKEFYQRFYGEK